MKRIPFYILAFCMAFAWSCSEEDEIKQVVNEDVSLRMLPKLSPAGSGLQFSFRSDSIYDCVNVGFQYTSKNTADDIAIHLLSVDVPDNCMGGHAPAMANIQVPGTAGYYSVAIDIGEHIHNTGLLEVTDISYKLYLNSRSGMTMPFDFMYRIPQGTIWGYVSNGDEYVSLDVLTMVDQAFDSVTDEADLHVGYYGHFVYKPNPVVEVQLLYPEVSFFPRSFIYAYHGNPADLEVLVQEIRDQLPAGMTLKVFSWQGEDY